MDLFTEHLRLKDIFPEVAKDIAKEYDLKEDDIEFVRKNNPLRAEDIKIEDGERAAIRYVNTADVDRDNEIVMPDGLQVKDFLKSPSVLYAHDYRGLPIGKDIWLKLIKGKGWLAKTIYAKHELAIDVYNLVKDKFLNTNSIGFIPLESVKPDSKKWDKTKAKLMAEYGIKEKLIDKVGRIYTNSILLEHSDVPIASNINALNVAVGKGFIKSDQLIKDLEIEIIDEKDEVELSAEGKKKLEESLKDIKEGRVERVDINDLEKEIKDEEREVVELTDEGEAMKFEDVEKPYPGEHACRLRSPGAFQSGSFRRVTRNSDGKVYSIIMGRLKGETTMTEQAYRYGIKVWTVSEARAHCKGHEGIAFEPASGKEAEDIDKESDNAITKEEEQNKGFIFDEIYEIIKENKELIKSLEEVIAELKAGAVLNRKNKTDLANAQKLIQNVLDSATSTEEGKELEIEEPAELEIKEDEKKEEESTEEKEERIDISADEIKVMVKEALDEQADKVGEKVKEIVNDNFKKMTGKVM